MTTRRTDTNRRILDVAERHVMQRGYHAFSYQHIADELQIKPAAVHYHFRTKSELVAAVLERYRRRFHRWAAAHAPLPPHEQIERYLELSRGFVTADRICALGMMATEFNVVPDAVRERTEALQGEIFAWWRDVLEAGRTAGVLQFEGPAEAKAAEVACALLGAQQLGRVRGAAAFELVAAQIRRSLGTTDRIAA